MTKSEALAYYGNNQSELARVLGMHQSTVCAWENVPPLRQLQLEALTGGKLKAGPECDKYRVPAAGQEAA